MSQLVLERELLMTPAARAQLSDPKQSELDLVAGIAPPPLHPPESTKPRAVFDAPWLVAKLFHNLAPLISRQSH